MAACFCALPPAVPQATHKASARTWAVPVSVKQLGNGLKVVVSEDHSAPTFGICLSYGIGFRLEPEGRSGFAHLFEHMMFEGTPNAPKGTLDKAAAGTMAIRVTILPNISSPHPFQHSIPFYGSKQTA
jgi:hypothetical protein